MHWRRWRKGQDINRTPARDLPDETKFWQRVKVSGQYDCWIWQGATRGNNGMMYGVLYANKKLVSAHRYSWVLANGEIPESDTQDYRGNCVCHSCDNPLCVNPNHLFLGTHLDNMHDKVSKGRGTESKTHCIHGHERNSKNTYISKSGLKHCRICHRLRERSRRKKLKASGG